MFILYIILFVLLALIITSFFIVITVVYNKKRNIDNSIKEYGFQYDLSSYKHTPFKIKNSRNELIYGDLYTTNDSKGLIITCHGFSCNRVYSYNYAKMFLEMGFDTLVYDHTHSGLSEGSRCGMGFYESEDLENIIQYIKSKYNYTIIGTHGESMGAATVLMHMGKYNSIDFTIADCTYESLKKQIKSRIKKLLHLPSILLLPLCNVFFQIIGKYSFTDIDVANSVLNIKKPFMLVHGSTDRYISVEDSLNIAKLNDNCKRLYICNGAKHARSYETDPDKYFLEIITFINSL